MRLLLILALAALPVLLLQAQDDYQPGPDSIAQPNVPKGELIKGTYTAKEGSVFPGTEREYTIYLPAIYNLTKASSWPFMVFQDGVIYNAPVVFDNLIAKGQIPPLIGIFIKPGIVPAANPNALPRYNRSYEYDSVSDTYSRFLIDEFLPAIEAKHGIKLSTDPNAAAIAGNSSGGICAFMTAWHRPDRFRRVFSGVGTYVGIHGADQLPVLVRKFEPKPLRIYLQSGEHDNDLYCGDWWMANQTMERALKWAGYDVNHTWGTGGHNAKHATAIFPDVLRWLWRDYSTAKEVKANPRGESKWVGYSVIGDGEWEQITMSEENTSSLSADDKKTVLRMSATSLTASQNGDVYFFNNRPAFIYVIPTNGQARLLTGRLRVEFIHQLAIDKDGRLNVLYSRLPQGELAHGILQKNEVLENKHDQLRGKTFAIDHSQRVYVSSPFERSWTGEGSSFISIFLGDGKRNEDFETGKDDHSSLRKLCFSADQSLLYGSDDTGTQIWSIHVDRDRLKTKAEDPLLNPGDKWDTVLCNAQPYYQLESTACAKPTVGGLCVDTNGWLYVATALGIQVCDQAGRVNFIIPTPQQPHDVCFGGKDLGELFIACGDKIYKRPTKAHGIVSGQMAPIKPAPPKL